MQEEKAKAAIEALLFAAGESLTCKQLSRLLDQKEQKVNDYINELISEYRKRDGGLMIRRVAGGYELTTSRDVVDYVRDYFDDSNNRKLSEAALETLAIVAYKQPVTRAVIEDIRGVQVSQVLQTLLGRELIEIKGRKETIGRPILYGTTRKFLEFFGLDSIKDLPPAEK